jgi:hypothetical protein
MAALCALEGGQSILERVLRAGLSMALKADWPEAAQFKVEIAGDQALTPTLGAQFGAQNSSPP